MPVMKMEVKNSICSAQYILESLSTNIFICFWFIANTDKWDSRAYAGKHSQRHEPKIKFDLQSFLQSQDGREASSKH